MKFETAAINDLRVHANRKIALEHIQKQIDVYKSDMAAVKAVSYRQAVATSGGNSTEINVINSIDMITDMERRFDAIKQLVDITDDILISMDKEQRLALEYFYIHPTLFAADMLGQNLNCGRRTAYRIKDAAIKEFIEKMYGKI